MSKRQHNRHTKRLETVFVTGTERYSGITSDVSDGGLFIRTRNPFAPGSILDIEIYLPDGKTSKLKGRVKNAIKTQITALKNGMGIELIEKDSNYINFIKTISGENGSSTPTTHQTSGTKFSILPCRNCGAKNRVKEDSAQLVPKCGKCGHPLILQEKTSDQPEYLMLDCANCRAKNKVAREKLSLNPRCGKCGTSLRAEDIV